MTEWLAAIEIAGTWIAIVSAGIFLPTMLALALYVLHDGEPGDTDVTPSMPPFGPRSASGRNDSVAYSGRSKLKRLVSGEKWITMESVVAGTVTRKELAAVIGAQIAFVTFWFIFLGLGLMKLRDTNGMSLILPVVVGLWLGNILAAQYHDFVKARRKLSREGKK